jgi:nucleoside-diphosphate-sugar epimerase
MVPLLPNSFVAAGGREKAPAAFCRKTITSTDRFEMWGDGKQTRSFTFIDECVEGVLRYLLDMAFHFIFRTDSCNMFLQIHLIYSKKSLMSLFQID